VGNYYGCPVIGGATDMSRGIYRWDHEYDSREWWCNELEDAMRKLYQ